MDQQVDSNHRRNHPLEKLNDPNNRYMRICAPMVRYSKLAFRELVRGYNVDLAYTPMILSDVFKHSQISRETEFRTHQITDDPVIVQFAASNPTDLADAAELVARYTNGVDLNCGCPQKWAISEGIGSYLMEHPELVRDMVKQVKSRTSSVKMANGTSFPCSIKIRIHSDLKKTVEFVRRAESIGVDWITVHGRTRKQKNTEPLNMDGIRIAKESVGVPVFANGNVLTLGDADRLVEETRVDGVMAARGLLENPALFSGYDTTPFECVEKFLKLSIGYGSTHFITHHHLMYMLDASMERAEKRHFNCLSTTPAIIDYLSDHYGISVSN
ncbi:hypothetical protein BATDEDRAFT_21188 [Batrachochytrium dendrobatidis JAM81]|uniref:tRNA-dihydrouridine synthase n=2 Tax=Batrachochytrium dendrobatidis TaxID=109871 RepID=F4NRL4_BATDJ|nr:uncharacterized protein BATDEDRAFT_21188 [Batrachochytrium dendrobatidis JAM81]EGF83750.1 hypothetical protein BATDEDRAFT_21188 [Batrachochytrium dendrobatidis JAM81]KAJ8331723.1 tRNA dihydrouridine synthase [Batrachochytrium dendrobatidis]KAK5672168.1 tRNA dihydrouridine synthase [Batrachochytrium dendrobatidis]OAJ35835.1 hypothetical protein BDEG_20067 [Batrachochytrium dendrobatidis JEL423]|eukprot:XP_006675221.1 hypothetical protein BATDEDRAFT_21188 [Batrachochytrium dendrobatidis JAM81]